MTIDTYTDTEAIALDCWNSNQEQRIATDFLQQWLEWYCNDLIDSHYLPVQSYCVHHLLFVSCQFLFNVPLLPSSLGLRTSYIRFGFCPVLYLRTSIYQLQYPASVIDTTYVRTYVHSSCFAFLPTVLIVVATTVRVQPTSSSRVYNRSLPIYISRVWSYKNVCDLESQRRSYMGYLYHSQCGGTTFAHTLSCRHTLERETSVHLDESEKTEDQLKLFAVATYRQVICSPWSNPRCI